MNREMILQLVCKEIRESWSAAALGMFLIGGFAMVSLQSRLIPDFTTLVICMFMSAIFAAICGMSPIASEREAGTLNLLKLLPIKPWQFLLVKLLVAAVIVAMPMLFAWLIFSVMVAGRELQMQKIHAGCWCSVLLSSMIVCWPVCIGIRQRTETRVGLLALGLIVSGIFFVCLMDNLSHLSQMFINWILLFCPLSLFAAIGGEYGKYGLLYSLAANLLMLGLLFTYASWQLSRPQKDGGE